MEPPTTPTKQSDLQRDWLREAWDAVTPDPFDKLIDSMKEQTHPLLGRHLRGCKYIARKLYRIWLERELMQLKYSGEPAIKTSDKR